MAVKSGNASVICAKQHSAQNSGNSAKGKPFTKGKSGNPGGRPKVPENLREACRALTMDAIETLRSVMADPLSPPNARVSAANAVLDRAWGRPTAETDLRIGGLPGSPAVRTSTLDMSKITPELAYAYLIDGCQLPEGPDMSGPG